MTSMRMEHLVATVNQTDNKLYEKMNLHCNAIIANQTNEVKYVLRNKKGNNIRMISTNTKGVGINRNLGMILSNADICILSDDDMRYNDDYVEIIREAFEKLKKADIIIFNLKTVGGLSNRRVNTKIKKIHFFNFMNYGAARIVFKRSSVMRKNIWFSELFGGGSKYSSGEDTIFLAESLKEKLKIYAFPAEIATVDQSRSTWFGGYNEKFFYDKGALIGQVFPRLKYLFVLLYYPCRFKSKLSYKNKVKCLCGGMKNYRNGLSYEEWKNMVK